MKPCVFTGSAVAIVTPFCGDGVDLEAFDRLIERQIQGGTDAIIVCGTTGEAATLSYNERMALIERCVRTADRRVPVIAGSGTNSTASSIALSKAAQSAGVDALLTVTPYYNKASQSGLVQHFSAIADSVDVPVILYNVPARTGVGCTVQTYQALAKHPNIVGVKEASGNIAEFALTRSICGDDLVFWSGNDSDTVPMMALGAVGVISVASNIIPKDVAKLCELGLAGDFKAAAAEYFRLADFFDKLFIETNPIPVKTAMNVAGMNVGKLRLPLVDMDPANLEKLKVSMRGVGLEV